MSQIYFNTQNATNLFLCPKFQKFIFMSIMPWIYFNIQKHHVFHFMPKMPRIYFHTQNDRFKRHKCILKPQCHEFTYFHVQNASILFPCPIIP